MSRVHQYLAERVFGEPVMMSESKLHQVMGVLLDGNYQPYAPPEDDKENDPEDSPIEVISVHGSLVKRGIGVSAMSGLTSYAELESDIREAAAAGKDILLDIDSPGGEAMGVFTLCDAISEVRKAGRKVYCVANPAYSAGYAIAAACERIYVPRDAEVGSIGVIAAHLDVSEAEKKAGVKYTLITAGAHKADMNPHQPLASDAKARMQGKVDGVYRQFVSLVARNRNISEQDVIDTQADIMRADQAVPKFADRVGTLRDALADMMQDAPPDPVANAVEAGAMKLLADEFTLTASMGASGKQALHLLENGWEMRCETSSVETRQIERDGRQMLTGILVPYNSPSNVLPGGFREIYEPGCFSESLKDDIRFLCFHDETKILGRTSAGTARLFDREDGLHFEVDLPDTSFGNDARVSIERGDIGGSSAGFYLRQGGFTMEQRGGEVFRRISKGQLSEGSITTTPAYKAATAELSTTSAQPSGPATALAFDEGLHALRLKQIQLAGTL